MGIHEAVVTVLVVAMVLGIPLMGLTIRFALKPLVEAWIRLREAQIAPSTEVLQLRERVAHLERVLESHGMTERRVSSFVEGTPERLPPNLPGRERV